MNDEGKNPLGFEVVDKRGRNNPIQEPAKPVVAQDDSPVKDRHWKSVGYLIVMNPQQDGSVLVMGRAAGLDQEGEVFLADYVFMPVWEPGFDWTIDAKRRLDTFLRCQCTSRNGLCQYHRVRVPHGWLKEDLMRMREQGDRPLPEVLEVLSRMERTKMQAQRIIAPRR